MCGSFGPPLMVHYPFHGIYISVVPEPVFVGIHADGAGGARPDGLTAYRESCA